MARTPFSGDKLDTVVTGERQDLCPWVPACGTRSQIRGRDVRIRRDWGSGTQAGMDLGGYRGQDGERDRGRA